MKTALVIGSTGLIGSQLVDILLESEYYQKVVIFVKRESGKSHPKLEQHIINFDAPETYQHLVKGDGVFAGAQLSRGVGTRVASKQVSTQTIRFF